MKGSSPLNNKIAKPRDHFENVTKLYKAIEKGELKTLSTIEPQNILEARFTNYKRNALHLAVWFQHPMLIRKVCDDQKLKLLLNEQDNNGDTPLHLAAYTKNVIAYRLLVQAGADENIINKASDKPLQTICDLKAQKDFIEKLNNTSNQLLVNDTCHELKLSTDVSKRPSIRIDGVEYNGRLIPMSPSSVQENGSVQFPSELKIKDVGYQGEYGSSANPKKFFVVKVKHKSDQEENLSDSDEDTPVELEFSKYASSQFSKIPKNMTYLKAISTINYEYSRNLSKTTSYARSNKRFGTWLMTRISNDTFYGVNKELPKPINESEDYVADNDPDF